MMSEAVMRDKLEIFVRRLTFLWRLMGDRRGVSLCGVAIFGRSFPIDRQVTIRCHHILNNPRHLAYEASPSASATISTMRAVQTDRSLESAAPSFCSSYDELSEAIAGAGSSAWRPGGHNNRDVVLQDFFDRLRKARICVAWPYGLND